MGSCQSYSCIIEEKKKEKEAIETVKFSNYDVHTKQELTTRYLGHSEQIKDIPNTEENRKADPNPRESPIAFVSGACIRK